MMKKRWLAIAVLTALLMVIGGTIGTVSIRQENVHSYSLYFVEEDLRAAGGGDALRAEERTVNDGALSTEELAGTLMEELMKGPVDPTLESPFPKGTGAKLVERRGRRSTWTSPGRTAVFPVWSCPWRIMPSP